MPIDGGTVAFYAGLAALVAGYCLVDRGLRYGLRRLQISGLVVLAAAGIWTGAHAQASRQLGADLQAIIDSSRARAEAASKVLEGFASAAGSRENPYRADAEQLQRDNESRVRAGMGLVDRKMFGDAGNPLEAQADGAFYVAVSLTMPADALRALSKDAQKAGGRLVIRGLVDNSFQKTFEAASRVFDKNALSGVAIEPQVFRAFKVERVPVFIAAVEPVQPCMGLDCVSAAPAHDKISGNISMGEALRELSERGTSARRVSQSALRQLEGR